MRELGTLRVDNTDPQIDWVFRENVEVGGVEVIGRLRDDGGITVGAFVPWDMPTSRYAKWFVVRLGEAQEEVRRALLGSALAIGR